MKRLSGILLVICLLLSGCGAASEPGVEVLSNAQYSIMERNGEYYFDFKEDVDQSTANGQMDAAIPGSEGFIFGSVKVMRDRIVNGGFSAANLSAMSGWAKTADGKVAVCDVNALWDAYLPQDMPLACVRWFGRDYSFVFENDDLEGRLYFTTESMYRRMQQIYDLEETENCKFISVEQVAERNATVITYESQVASSGKQISYTYTENGFTVTIFKEYLYDYSDETVPFIVIGMAEGNGIYYYWSVGGFTERPSYEWIKSIGLKPYVETESE